MIITVTCVWGLFLPSVFQSQCSTTGKKTWFNSRQAWPFQWYQQVQADHLNSLLCSDSSEGQTDGSRSQCLFCPGRSVMALQQIILKISSFPWWFCLWTMPHASEIWAIKQTVLDLAGINLVFFQAADTMLCFGSRMRIMLISHWSFQLFLSSTYTNQGLVSISYCPAGEKAGSSQKLGRGPSQDICLPADQRGIPDLLAYAEQQNWGGIGRRGLTACSSGTGWTLVSSWWTIVHYLLCILFYHYFPYFFHPIKPLLFQPISFAFSSDFLSQHWG